MRQAKALLLAADGVGTNEVAQALSDLDRLGARLASALRKHEGVEGVGRIAKGRGPQGRGCPKAPWPKVVHDTLHESPDDGSTHWTTRLMAERFGIGKDTVARIWHDHDLKPWQLDTFKVSNDPALRGEAGRRGRALHEPPRARHRVQLR